IHGCFTSVNCKPSRILDYFSFALEGIFLDARDASRHFKLRSREKDGDEPAHDHVVNFLLRFIEAMRRLPAGNNRKVIGNFCVIENPLGRFDPAIIQRFTSKLIVDLAQGRSDRRNIVFWQVAGIGARISDYFEALVKLLRDLQGAFCAEPARVRVPLYTGKIIKQWRRLGCWLAFFRRDPGFAETTILDFFRSCFVPNPFGARFFVAILCEIFAEPSAAVDAGFDFEIGEYFKERARLEIMNFLLPLRQDSEGWGLHAANWRQLETPGLVGERGHGAGAVYSNEPVALRAADGCLGQRNHFLIRPETLKGRADRFGGHRLEPETLDWLFAPAQLYEITKDELAFAPGIARVNQQIDIFSLNQAFQGIEARLRFLNRLQLKLIWNDRKIRETPFAAFDVQLAWQGKLDQMSKRGRNDVTIIFKMIAFLFEATERASEVACDARFLGNDKCLGHLEMQPKLSFAPIANCKLKTRASLAQFHKVFPGQLLNEPLQFEPEKSRRDDGAWQIALGSNLIDRCLGRINGVINAPLFLRKWWQRARGGSRRGFCFRQENLQIIQNIAGVHDQLRALLDKPIRTHRARRVDVAGHRVN